MRILLAAAALLAATLAAPAHACTEPVSVCAEAGEGSFALIERGEPAAILVDASADPAVRHAADGFAADLERVSGHAPRRLESAAAAAGPLVIVGQLGRSPIVDGLAREGKLAAGDIAGEWEAFRQIVVDRPFPGVERALVIVGSDRRGAVFGTYDLSEKIGVSPWYWFADVQVQRRSDLFLTAGARRDQPSVRYRGFFINDENPGFDSWAKIHFGGINSRMYAHVFELLLRLKGNYLWPAMWEPKAFNDDDPQNMVLADAMGVVMGTSHHEPLTRAHAEWHRNTAGGVTGGAWDYRTNAANLRTFWRGGIERMMSKGDGTPYESVVTVGMRGDGDEAMADDTATELLETIVADQRRIIAEVTGRPAAQTPQIWALYKEVQDYYDNGMQVPDDVTLLFADDNWGQIRRLPTADRERMGGFGVYYHFDYVGGPRNYKWLTTVQIEKTWQQMDLAWQSGARTLWIVNVGDIKPVEFPLDFFLRQAWDPEAMTLEALARYPEAWASGTFGPAHAHDIGALVTRYSQLAARRKPELLDADSLPLGDSAGPVLDGGAFGATVAEWQALETDMLALRAAIPEEQHAAFFQLVEHPVAAFSNLYQLYYAVAWNRRLAAAGDVRANAFADRAEALYRRDAEITAAYHAINGGKWDGMMRQTHIGYTTWQQPDEQVMPRIERVPTAGPPPAIEFGLPSPGADHGAVEIEAPDFTRAIDGAGLTWRAIPHLGHTAGAVTAFPQGRPPTGERDGVRLEYDVVVGTPGDQILQLHLVPTLDVTGRDKLRIGISLDDGPMQVLSDSLIPAAGEATLQAHRDWNAAVIDNRRVLEHTFADVPAGRHVVKLWRIDDNAVVQRLVLAPRSGNPGSN